MEESSKPTGGSRRPTMDLPPQAPQWDPDPVWRCGEPLRHTFPTDGKSWERCQKIIRDFDDGMCLTWQDEIQSLLIFAGLFSAIVTAFTVEASKELQESPNNASIQLQLLVRISSQLSNATNIPLPEIEPFTPSRVHVRVNTLWSVSLTLSLTTVVVGILCLQWIREYQRYPTESDPDTALKIRQDRYKSLTHWKVPFIVSVLPLMLQIALALFLVALVEYFHSMYPPIGICLGVFVGITLSIVLTTTVLPALYEVGNAKIWDLRMRDAPRRTCAYRSPQSWGFAHLYFRITDWLLSGLAWRARPLKYCRNWSAVDRLSLSYHNPGLIWLANMSSLGRQNPSVLRDAYECSQDIRDEAIAWATTIRMARAIYPDFVNFPSWTVDMPVRSGDKWPFSTLLKDLSLFVAGEAIHSSGLLQPEERPHHFLYRLELFIRIKTSVMCLLAEVDNPVMEISAVKEWVERTVAQLRCPLGLNGMIDGGVGKIPSIPGSLRVQLFQILNADLSKVQDLHSSETNLHGTIVFLLTTLILDPIGPLQQLTEEDGTSSVPPPSYCTTTQSILDVGFSTILAHLQALSPPGSSRPPRGVSSAIRVTADIFYLIFISPLTAEHNEDVFLTNKHYIEKSDPFWELVSTLRQRAVQDRNHRILTKLGRLTSMLTRETGEKAANGGDEQADEGDRKSSTTSLNSCGS